jgi:hypothetical protein
VDATTTNQPTKTNTTMNTTTTTTTTTTTATTTTAAIVRAFAALSIPLRDVQWYSCDSPVYRIPAALPTAVTAWLARHPEASAEERGWRPTADSISSWKARFKSVRYVLDAPPAHRAAAKRSYKASLGLSCF